MTLHITKSIHVATHVKFNKHLWTICKWLDGSVLLEDKSCMPTDYDVITIEQLQNCIMMVQQ